MSLENLYNLLWYCFVNDGEALSTFSQFVEQMEVIQEVVFPGIYKLNDSAVNKEQGDQTQFSPNKDLKKGKWIC